MIRWPDWLRKHSVPYHFVKAQNGDVLTLATGLAATPTTLLLDRNYKVEAVFRGVMAPAIMKSFVKTLTDISGRSDRVQTRAQPEFPR